MLRTRDNAWSCRRALVRRATGSEARAGGTYGHVALVVTLWEPGDGAPQLVFDTEAGNEALETAVRTQFEARIASERYVAADITKWLGELLRRKLGAVRYGRAWYVPRETRTIAEALTGTLRESGWGHSWLYPALPITTSAQLSRGVAIGLQQEVASVMADLHNSRQAAAEAGRGDIGPRAVETFVGKINEVSTRINRYALTLGEELRKECDDVIADALIALDELAGQVQAAA